METKFISSAIKERELNLDWTQLRLLAAPRHFNNGKRRWKRAANLIAFDCRQLPCCLSKETRPRNRIANHSVRHSCNDTKLNLAWPPTLHFEQTLVIKNHEKQPKYNIFSKWTHTKLV